MKNKRNRSNGSSDSLRSSVIGGLFNVGITLLQYALSKKKNNNGKILFTNDDIKKAEKTLRDEEKIKEETQNEVDDFSNITSKQSPKNTHKLFKTLVSNKSSDGNEKELHIFNV